MNNSIWPRLEDLPKDTISPPQYRYRQLSREDVEPLTELVKVWHPDVAVGLGKCFSDPQFYYDNVSLAGEPDTHIIVYVGLFEGEMISVMCEEVNFDNRTLFSRFGVCAPEHRGTGATLFAGYAIDALADKMDISMAYGYVTMKNRGMQQMTERAGFNPVGILKFSDIERNADGEERHVVEAIYAKYYKTDAELEPVLEGNMTPKLQALWKTLETVPGL